MSSPSFFPTSPNLMSGCFDFTCRGLLRAEQEGAPTWTTTADMGKVPCKRSSPPGQMAAALETGYTADCKDDPKERRQLALLEQGSSHQR